MEDPSERARKLVALATDKGAAPEEARSAAMAACRLIAKHKMLEGGTGPGQTGPRRRSGRAAAPPEHGRRSPREPRHEERASYRATRTGTCAFCANVFRSDDDVMTYPDGSVDHWHCAKRRAAGAGPGI